ncbi:hypothetical protein BCR43DRAFT_494111 [Syncephalastrum racemosum]|uniref:Secreted protein n=1 Tax=Syncephalastrum racemosum TaxID=13706 RepID=A0A1X2H7D8_SYNRA|nr:hypothetical protein BCR43DRAFT_494111 [Syncephalastrum racemosum]
MFLLQLMVGSVTKMLYWRKCIHRTLCFLLASFEAGSCAPCIICCSCCCSLFVSREGCCCERGEDWAGAGGVLNCRSGLELGWLSAKGWAILGRA